MTQAEARNFITSCIEVLEHPASVGHPLEDELDGKMRDVARRIEGVMMHDAWRGMQRTADLRAFHRSGLAIAALRRSDAAVHDDLPLFAGLDAAATLRDADAAVLSLRIHDDPGPVDALLEHVGPTALGRLLSAHRRVAAGDLRGAIRDLDMVHASTDPDTGRDADRDPDWDPDARRLERTPGRSLERRPEGARRGGVGSGPGTRRWRPRRTSNWSLSSPRTAPSATPSRRSSACWPWHRSTRRKRAIGWRASGRYREAVLALETGRAVALSESLGRESVAVVERLHSAGRDDLGTEPGGGPSETPYRHPRYWAAFAYTGA